MIQAIPEWDKQIFYAINGFRSGVLDVVMPVLSYIWLPWVVGLAAFAVWTVAALWGKHKKCTRFKPILFAMALILGTAGVNDLITNAVKDHIGRVRPYQSLPYAHFQTRTGWTQNSGVFTPRKHRADSFFSGHASHSMALAVTAAAICPPLSPAIYAMPLAVGYSRIYIGKHYPSDVLAGWLVGACIGFLTRRLTRGIRASLRREQENLLPARPPANGAPHLSECGVARTAQR